MQFLIDGYNLLHASGVFPTDDGPATLERAREALLNFLLDHLTEKEARRTTIVFDAANPPVGVADRYSRGGLQVLFARNRPAADDLIEDLIEQSRTPRVLTVVSSDHRLQRAARRRSATYVDSAAWCTELVQRGQADEASPPRVDKPPAPETPEEVAFWLEEMAVDEFDLPEPTLPPKLRRRAVRRDERPKPDTQASETTHGSPTDKKKQSSKRSTSEIEERLAADAESDLARGSGLEDAAGFRFPEDFGAGVFDGREDESAGDHPGNSP